MQGRESLQRTWRFARPAADSQGRTFPPKEDCFVICQEWSADHGRCQVYDFIQALTRRSTHPAAPRKGPRDRQQRYERAICGFLMLRSSDLAIFMLSVTPYGTTESLGCSGFSC